MNACALMNLFICFGEPQAGKLRRNRRFTQTVGKHKGGALREEEGDEKIGGTKGKERYGVFENNRDTAIKPGGTTPATWHLFTRIQSQLLSLLCTVGNGG